MGSHGGATALYVPREPTLPVRVFTGLVGYFRKPGLVMAPLAPATDGMSGVTPPVSGLKVGSTAWMPALVLAPPLPALLPQAASSGDNPIAPAAPADALRNPRRGRRTVSHI